MKINEIITEAPLGDIWNRAKAGVKGAVKGYQQSQQARQSAEDLEKHKLEVAKSAKEWVDKWVKQTSGDPATAQDPNAFQRYATQVAGNFTRQGGKLPPPTNMNVPELTAYMVGVLGKEDAAALVPAATQSNANPSTATPTASAKPSTMTHREVGWTDAASGEHRYATKDLVNNKWYNDAGDLIINGTDITRLDGMLKDQTSNVAMATPGGAPSQIPTRTRPASKRVNRKGRRR